MLRLAELLLTPNHLFESFSVNIHYLSDVRVFEIPSDVESVEE